MIANTFDFEHTFRAAHYEEHRETNIPTNVIRGQEINQQTVREEWVPLENYPERSISDFLIERQMRMIIYNRRDDSLPFDIETAAQLYNELRMQLTDPSSMPVAQVLNRDEIENHAPSSVALSERESEPESDFDDGIVHDIDILDRFLHNNF